MNSFFLVNFFVTQYKLFTKAGEKQIVVFSREGVIVQEERETPLTGDTKTVTVDELDWDSFPMNLLMEVTSVEPIPNTENGSGLSELRFSVSRLERSPTETRSQADEFWAAVEENTGITKRDGSVSLSGDKNAKNNLVAFVEFLLTHGYLSRDDLPVKSGWKRYLLNTEPVHQQGDDMNQSEEVGDGIYLETKYSRKDIQKKISELAARFGE